MTRKYTKKAKTETQIKPEVPAEKPEKLELSHEWIPRKQIFRPDEVADLLSVGRDAIYRWIQHGHFGTIIELPGGYRISRENIIWFINNSKLGKNYQKMWTDVD